MNTHIHRQADENTNKTARAFKMANVNRFPKGEDGEGSSGSFSNERDHPLNSIY